VPLPLYTKVEKLGTLQENSEINLSKEIIEIMAAAFFTYNNVKNSEKM
jgi:hypothetical protein